MSRTHHRKKTLGYTVETTSGYTAEIKSGYITSGWKAEVEHKQMDYSGASFGMTAIVTDRITATAVNRMLV